MKLINGYVCLSLFVTIACGGSASKDLTGKNVTAYVYSGDCSNSVCPAAPSTSTEAVVECSKNSAGKCDWNPGSAAGGSSGDDAVTSFEPCTEKECGPVQEIGCASGYQRSVVCGKENGGKCQNFVVCSETPTKERCPDEKCGPMPAIAQVCDEGMGAVTRCLKTNAGVCRWNFGCEGMSYPQ